MPPNYFRPPRPIQFKVPSGEIPIQRNPLVQMGKTLVAQQALRITSEKLEEARKTLRKFIGKSREFRVNVHATFPVTKRPEGVKRGQGRGAIDHHVARVPAGKPIFQIPNLTPLPGMVADWRGFRTVALTLPSKFQFRDQTNVFAFDRKNIQVPARVQMRKNKTCLCFGFNTHNRVKMMVDLDSYTIGRIHPR